MTFADAILKLRSERRMSQTQLAKELGVSYTSVNRWENGVSVGSSRPRFVGSNEPLFVGKPEANR